MRRFFVLFRKEFKELATLQTLVPFVLIMAVFALIGQVVGAQGTEAEAQRTIAIIDQDASAASRLVIQSAEAAGFAVTTPDTADPKAVLENESGPSVLVVIPDGFGASVDAGSQAKLDTYVAVRNFSVMGSSDAAALSSAVAVLSQTLQRQLVVAEAPGLDPEVAMRPLAVAEHVVIGSREAAVSPDVVMGFIMTQTTFVPIVLFVVIMFASQMVAAALASEKENKTLESLLAMPISRSAIAIAKMVAAGLIALGSAAAYMVGLRYLQDGLTKGFAGEGATDAVAESARVASDLGLTLGTSDYVLLGVSLFFAILVALAISLILGAFAENVKAVQPLLTPLIMAIMIPYFLSMFVDVSALPAGARVLIYAVPFTHPFLAAPSLFVGNTQPVLLGIAYQALWFVVLVIVAGRIFRSDRLLTMRLNLSRKRAKSGGGL